MQLSIIRDLGQPRKARKKNYGGMFGRTQPAHLTGNAYTEHVANSPCTDGHQPSLLCTLASKSPCSIHSLLCSQWLL